MIFVMKFQAAAMSRANIPESERRDFALYVDEFQNFSTDSFATILSEARKYHLSLIVANQFTTQLTEEIRDAVFGNTGTIVAFRVGQDEDAEALAKRMRPAFDPTDMLRMPNYNAGVRMLVSGVPTQPFSMATLPPLGDPNYKLADALKQLSAAKYGRPKAQVEKEIFDRLATKEVAPPARPFGSGQPTSYGPTATPPVSGVSPAGARPPGAPAAAPPGTGSFLDEWMSKRQSKGPLLRPNPWSKGAPAPAAATTVPTQQTSLQPNPVAGKVAPATVTGMPSPVASTAPSIVPPAVELPSSPSVAYGNPAEVIKPDTMVERELEVAARTAEEKLKHSESSLPEAGQSPVPEQKKPEAANSGEIPLFKNGNSQEEDDTIFIDKDGTLHMR
jgi:hypothetical protein